MEILDQSVRAVTVDQKRLHQLLDKTVAKTEGCNIEELEKIYSIMSQCIYRHRLNHDKTRLLHVSGNPTMHRLLERCSLLPVYLI